MLNSPKKHVTQENVTFESQIHRGTVQVLDDLANYKTLKCQGIPIKSSDVDVSVRLRAGCSMFNKILM
jgi:hypothetical protein